MQQISLAEGLVHSNCADNEIVAATNAANSSKPVLSRLLVSK